MVEKDGLVSWLVVLFESCPCIYPTKSSIRFALILLARLAQLRRMKERARRVWNKTLEEVAWARFACGALHWMVIMPWTKRFTLRYEASYSYYSKQQITQYNTRASREMIVIVTVIASSDAGNDWISDGGQI